MIQEFWLHYLRFFSKLIAEYLKVIYLFKCGVIKMTNRTISNLHMNRQEATFGIKDTSKQRDYGSKRRYGMIGSFGDLRMEEIFDCLLMTGFFPKCLSKQQAAIVGSPPLLRR